VPQLQSLLQRLCTAITVFQGQLRDRFAFKPTAARSLLDILQRTARRNCAE